MFSTSSDILYLVIAVCVLFLTVFVCVLLYNLVTALRRVNRIAKAIENGVTKIEEVVALAKSKLQNSSAYFMILAEVAKRAMDFVKDKRAENSDKKKKTRK